MSFHDHFSGHAASYATFRPTYPDELFRILAESCVQHRLAWDCATGNGQAAAAVAEHFARVIATDASAEQIEAAPARRGVEFRVGRAEESGIEDRSVERSTVAQARHGCDILYRSRVLSGQLETQENRRHDSFRVPQTKEYVQWPGLENGTPQQ